VAHGNREVVVSAEDARDGVPMKPGTFVPDKPEFVQMAMLSTAHLPKHIAEAFNEDDSDDASGAEWRAFMPLWDRVEYGYLLWVPTDSTDGLPAELRAIFNWAREERCQWVKFDSDGPIIADLPAWSW
jgi:hypothetical protein